jgi:hypothetical protein
MTGERVFCSRLKREIPTNLNPPRHLRERYYPRVRPATTQRTHRLSIFLNQ